MFGVKVVRIGFVFPTSVETTFQSSLSGSVCWKGYLHPEVRVTCGQDEMLYSGNSSSFCSKDNKAQLLKRRDNSDIRNYKIKMLMKYVLDLFG